MKEAMLGKVEKQENKAMVKIEERHQVRMEERTITACWDMMHRGGE